MSKSHRFSRRGFLRMSALGASALLAACAPKVIKETVVVEKEVEKVVKETVIVAGTPKVVEKVTTAQPAPGGKVVITWWGYPKWSGIGFEGDDPSGRPTDYMQYMKERFEEQNPQCTVNIEYPIKTEGTTYWAKIDSAVLARQSPNMVMGAVSEAARFVGLGIVDPVDEYIPKQLVDDFAELAWSEGEWYGKHYFYPWRLSFGGGLAINNWLVKKYGNEDLLPKGEERDWTTDEFFEFLKAMTIDIDKDGKTDIYGGVFCGTVGYEIFQFLFGFGAKFWNEDETEVILNSPEGVEGLEWLVDLEWKHKVLMPGTAGRSWEEKTQMMQENRAALMHCQGAGTPYGDLIGLPEYEHFYAPPPHQPGKEWGVQTNIQGYYVMKDPRGNKDADLLSHKFLQLLISDEAMKILTAVGMPSARKSFLDQLAKKDTNVKAAMAMLKRIRSFGRRGPCATINYGMGKDVVQAVFSRQKTAKQALDDFAAEANQLIKESIEKDEEAKKRLQGS